MSSGPQSVGQRFSVVCAGCERPFAARPDWIGRTVQCPHCGLHVVVPEPGSGRAAPTACMSMTATMQRFTFGCPRCHALLESHTGMCGQAGRCPTCNAQFVVPAPSGQPGNPPQARLLQAETQDPTPMHAYAASGHQAPRIVKGPKGEPAIECPRCKKVGPITANNCPGCGTPFTIEGVPLTVGRPGEGLATTALVLGIVSVPLYAAIVLGPLALAFGLASWLRRASPLPSGKALAGIILGLGATALALTWLL